MNQKIQQILQNPRDAMQYVQKQKHSNASSVFGSTTQPVSAFSNSSVSSFGGNAQPVSAFAAPATNTFGANSSTTTSAFGGGSTNVFGSSGTSFGGGQNGASLSAFGGNSTIQPNNPFQQARQTSAFGGEKQPTSAFGQPSAFASTPSNHQGSVFGGGISSHSAQLAPLTDESIPIEYRMDKFEFGKIPELAPPPNAC
jgi:hypothetical protein